MDKPILFTEKTIIPSHGDYRYKLVEVEGDYYELQYVETGRETETFTIHRDELALIGKAINELISIK